MTQVKLGTPFIRMVPTLWQTVGPYFSLGLDNFSVPAIAQESTVGRHITVSGSMSDGGNHPIPDAVLEIWQANSGGRYAHPADTQNKSLDAGFRGFGRVATDDEGRFEFTTIQPGRAPGPEGKDQAPHLLIGLLMRGLLRRLTTRIYFPDEPSNEEDPILKRVPIVRRKTLLLERISDHPNSYRWDIHMQGENETVFLEF
jgi:protocatechuate 3,4-dioxygenase alpha subunit